MHLTVFLIHRFPLTFFIQSNGYPQNNGYLQINTNCSSSLSRSESTSSPPQPKTTFIITVTGIYNHLHHFFITIAENKLQQQFQWFSVHFLHANASIVIHYSLARSKMKKTKQV
jgi:cytochrome oxidase assembly protein ShyY1